MTKRSFPDINVWFALAVGDHPHHRAARAWWEADASLAGWARVTQLGFLRLLTTAAAMLSRHHLNPTLMPAPLPEIPLRKARPALRFARRFVSSPLFSTCWYEALPRY